MWLLVAEGGRERERPLMDVVIDVVVDFLLGKGKGQRREGDTEAASQSMRCSTFFLKKEQTEGGRERERLLIDIVTDFPFEK